MPRMNLTDQEAEIILKKREDERFYNAGWNGALDAATALLEKTYTTAEGADYAHDFSIDLKGLRR